jgi:hypothetical protein
MISATVSDPLKGDNAMKPEIYESLHVINQATKQITEHTEKLRDEELIAPQIAEIRILAAQQNCAETNVHVISSISQREIAEASRIEKERLALENKLKS